ncbi:MAG TPA: DUF3185 domain-containing protein [Chthoniobacteraceae bacterium]|nr:DUF3185 domain-containing protein [Chthoniobacteraceae bacterium]
MKSARIIGIILIALGVLALAIPVFSYTEEKEILKLGPIEAKADVERNVPVPPAVGWGLLVAGVGVVGFSLVGRR